MESISRRNLITGSAVLGAAAAAGQWAVQAPASARATETSNPDWLEEPPTIDEAGIAQTIDADIVVVGAGNAGSMCAARAAEAGANVVVLERMGLQTTARNFLGAVGTRWQEEAGYPIDRNAIVNDLMRYASGWASHELLNLWADNSAAMLEYIDGLLETGGAGIMLEYGMPEIDTYTPWPTNHFPAASRGVADGNIRVSTIEYLTKHAEENGAQFLFETELVKAETDGERVTGVIAQNVDGEYLRINAAKGVVLATGGYAGNTQMLDALQPWLNNLVTTKMATDTSQGSGIKAGLWLGAAMQVHPTAMLFDRGLIPAGGNAGAPFEGSIWSGCSQPTLRVNRQGRRFSNESMPYDFNSHAAKANGDGTWFQIMDANYTADFEAYQTMGCSRLVAGPGTGFSADGNEPGSMDATVSRLEGLVEEGLVQRADTIEELAEKLGLPADQLVATVERYNELAAKGSDDDFGKEPSRLRPVQEAPFYGMQVGSWLLCTLDGLCVNSDFAVLDEQDQPIEGLYAIGNDSGNFFCGNYPELVVGVAVGRSLTSGYLLGEALANR